MDRESCDVIVLRVLPGGFGFGWSPLFGRVFLTASLLTPLKTQAGDWLRVDVVAQKPPRNATSWSARRCSPIEPRLSKVARSTGSRDYNVRAVVVVGATRPSQDGDRALAWNEQLGLIEVPVCLVVKEEKDWLEPGRLLCIYAKPVWGEPFQADECESAFVATSVVGPAADGRWPANLLHCTTARLVDATEQTVRLSADDRAVDATPAVWRAATAAGSLDALHDYTSFFVLASEPAHGSDRWRAIHLKPNGRASTAKSTVRVGVANGPLASTAAAESPTDGGFKMAQLQLQAAKRCGRPRGGRMGGRGYLPVQSSWQADTPASSVRVGSESAPSVVETEDRSTQTDAVLKQGEARLEDLKQRNAANRQLLQNLMRNAAVFESLTKFDQQLLREIWLELDAKS